MKAFFNYSLGPIIFLVCLASCSTAQQPPKAKVISSEAVVTYHPIATEVGEEILKQGGNAFDAYIAATAVEYVLGEGVTSIAGPMGAILYDAKTKTSVYLDAGFNTPIDEKQKWDAQNLRPGAAALVPGAVAGLEAISKKYGSWPLAKTLAPAIQLAENGFALNKEYADILHSDYAKTFRSNPYTLKTYFKNGEALEEGEILKLPMMAEFLKQFSAKGSEYVYRGEWAKECLKVVNSNGGHLREKDFSNYHANWLTPWHINYRGYDIYSARTGGGLNTALSLKVLEKVDLDQFGKHFSKSADAIELMAHIQYEVMILPELRDGTKINEPQFENDIFSSAKIDSIWSRVRQRIDSRKASPTGSHSYQIVVIDKEGNAISGTNTIESFPFGKGLFVKGVPLTASGILALNTKPGERRKTALTMQVGLKNQKLHFASGAFSASMTAAAFEFIVNILDYHLPSEAVVTMPRYGEWAWDMQTMKPIGGIWMDPRIEPAVISTLESRGIKVVNQGYIDTGLGSVAIVDDDGHVDGAIVPLTSNRMAGEKFAGIGAKIEVGAKHEIFVREVLANSPALKVGLQKGDIILDIRSTPESAKVTASEFSIAEILKLVRGPIGTKVVLTVLRKPSAQKITLEIVRDEIK